MHFVSHDRRQIRVEHVSCRRAKHHVKHAQLNTTVEKQAELRQKTNLHNMAVARQHHHHEHNKRHRKHVHQMERPTPAERVRNPRANRHTHHGCDGEAGKHPCDELRAVLFSCYIGRVRHGDSHQRARYQCDENSRHHEHAIIRRERAQHVANKEHPNQRQMRGKTRKTSRQRRSERRDRRIHEREQRHKIADRHLRHLQTGRDIR